MEGHQRLKDLLETIGLCDTRDEQVHFAFIKRAHKLWLQTSDTRDTSVSIWENFIQRVLLMDKESRSQFLHFFDEEESANLASQSSWLEDQESTNLGETLHPMDVFLAIYQRSDEIVKKELLTRMSFCQMAVPLVIPSSGAPDTLIAQNWPLRGIRKTFQSGECVTSTKFLHNYSMPLVSFVRLGDNPKVSKSETINMVINEGKHATFYHRQGLNGSTKRLLFDGVIEISWVCNGSKKKLIEGWPGCTTVANLRGDLRHFRKQYEFLNAISTVMVLFCEDSSLEEDMMEVLQQRDRVILATTLTAKNTKLQPTKYRVGLKGKNNTLMSSDLQKRISELIQDAEEKKERKLTLEECTVTLEKFETSSMKVVQSFVKNVTKHITNETWDSIKRACFPAQGEQWKKWCNAEKEKYRLKINAYETLEQIKSNIERRQAEARQGQLQYCLPLNRMIEDFMKMLKLVLGGSSRGIYYFIQLLHQSLNEQNERLEPERKPGESLSIDNIIREVGQIYEVCQGLREDSNPRTRQIVKEWPDMIAPLVMHGLSFEIFNGGNAQVPLKWVEAVLRSLIKQIGNKRIFVMSVLGLQSSGKSTLLNTMFGLQLQTSGGRCTRGVFMQVIPVDEEITEQLGYELVVVLDAQGLHSSEEGVTDLTDNALATFLIGVGDVTLVNVKHENIRSIEDILGICIEALATMIKVDIHPKCILIHQNMEEPDARETNSYGHHQFHNRLAHVARAAASRRELDIEDINDLLQFDIERNVFFFSNFWDGNPPMAAVNVGYSEDAQNLRPKLLCTFKPQRLSTLQEFTHRIRDVWRGVLQENFIFSFTNSLEIEVHEKLQAAHHGWNLILHETAHEIMIEAGNELKNGVQLQEVRSQIIEKMRDNTAAVLEELEAFFDTHDDRTILIKWQSATANKVRNLSHELRQNNVETCVRMSKTIQMKRKMEQERQVYEKKMLKCCKVLAVELRKGEAEINLQEHFETLWNDVLNQLEEFTCHDLPTDQMGKDRILATVQSVLMDKYNVTELKETRPIFDKEIHQKTSMPKKLMARVFEIFNGSPEKFAEEALDAFLEKVDDFLADFEKTEQEFTENMVHTLLNKNEAFLKKQREDTRMKIFTSKLLEDWMCFACFRAIPTWVRMDEKFRKNNNMRAYLVEKRDEYFAFFRLHYESTNSLIIYGRLLSSALMAPITAAMRNRSVKDITKLVRDQEPVLGGSRSDLEKHILRYLAEKGEFEAYVDYFHKPKITFRNFIETKLKEFLRGHEKQLHQICVSQLGELQIILNNAATAAFSQDGATTNTMLEDFATRVRSVIEFPEAARTHLSDELVEDGDFFHTVMLQMIDDLFESKRAALTSDGAVSQDETLFGLLVPRIFEISEGCWEKCPFCHAVCTNPTADHEGNHATICHRVDSLLGWSYSDSDEFCVSFCSTNISSNQKFMGNDGKYVTFTQYKKAGHPFDEWNIAPDHQPQLYWKWFIHTFRKNLEERQKKQFKGRGEIPKNWFAITKDAAIESLFD